MVARSAVTPPEYVTLTLSKRRIVSVALSGAMTLPIAI